MDHRSIDCGSLDESGPLISDGVDSVGLFGICKSHRLRSWKVRSLCGQRVSDANRFAGSRRRGFVGQSARLATLGVAALVPRPADLAELWRNATASRYGMDWRWRDRTWNLLLQKDDFHQSDLLVASHRCPGNRQLQPIHISCVRSGDPVVQRFDVAAKRNLQTVTTAQRRHPTIEIRFHPGLCTVSLAGLCILSVQPSRSRRTSQK